MSEPGSVTGAMSVNLDSRGPYFSRHALPWKLSPEEVLGLVRDDEFPVALIGAWAGGAAIIASEPLVHHAPPDALADVLSIRYPNVGQQRDHKRDLEEPSLGLVRNSVSGGFGGGWIGYLGYGLAENIASVAPAPGGLRVLPVWWFGFYDHVLRQVTKTGEWFFEALWTAERADELSRRFRDLRQRASGLHRSRRYVCSGFSVVPSAAAHQQAVRTAKEYIKRGDIFQANICLRLEADFQGDPLDIFSTGRRLLEPPYSAFLRFPEGAVASFSPELFLRRRERNLLSKPIKGTSRRSADPAEAEMQRLRLEESPKNRAENLMIVDLMRNDLSRVCLPGTVGAPRLVQAEPYPGLWHLVSNVHGVLRPECTDEMLVRATFPPGSVTGAPKVRAMEVIHELESSPREIYTGSIGYSSPLAGLELNVAIRTFEFASNQIWLGAGGGIVADSNAHDELQEALIKANPLINAIGSCVRTRGSSVLSHPSAAERAMRPRAVLGVFTSALVVNGTCPGLVDHLGRLEDSVRHLYGKGMPESVQERVLAYIGAEDLGRLRIHIRPLGGSLKIELSFSPGDFHLPAVSLCTELMAGGLGAHKWTDRRGLDRRRKRQALREDEQLLFQGADSYVLETDRSNVFAVAGGTIRTPVTDGRILPGITRAHLLDHFRPYGCRVEAAPVHRRDLDAASEVFVTNAVRGVVPVTSIDGQAVPSVAGPVTRAAIVVADRFVGRGQPARAPSYVRENENGTYPCRIKCIKSILVIDNYDSFTYNLVDMLRAEDCKVDIIHNDEASADEVAASGAAGIVISPGPCTPEEAGISIDVVRKCPVSTPLLGVCLGHQAIVSAFGGMIRRAPCPVHGKTSLIVHDGQGIFSGLPSRFEATRYHSLIADEALLPRVLEVSARTTGGIVMAVRYPSRPLNGVQFHPESILTNLGSRIIKNFLRTVVHPAALPWRS
jgi:para-aminobenzoate synthetase/4-amino-4-deoxychorismate lyase